MEIHLNKNNKNFAIHGARLRTKLLTATLRTAHLHPTNEHAIYISGELVHILMIHLYQFHLMPQRLACFSARYGCASLLFYIFPVIRSAWNG